MLDAGFLKAEDSDPHVSLAIGGLAIVEGPIPDDDSLLPALTQRLLSIPRFRQVLRTYPLDLGAPHWVDDVGLDISHHVHRAALPCPGDDKALFRLTADVMERRLDRDRPLWECWIVEGLSENRWAILVKVHHCIADGIAATHMLAKLSDDGDGETFATRISGAKEPTSRGIGLPDLTFNPLHWITGMWHTSFALTTAAARAVQGAIEIAGGLVRPVATSSLNGPITNMRRYSTARVSLDDVATVRKAFDVTINDVALAAITDSYRGILVRRGEQPQHNSLRTLVPVSVRANDAADKTDSRVSIMLPDLPVDIEDPVKQLQAVHQRLTRTKGSGQRQAGSVFVSAANLIPFALSAWTVRALTRLPQRSVTALATNVPGPRNTMQIMGHNVIGLLPIPPIALQLRTGIAMLSYADDLIFGITGDYDAAPDVDELAEGIEKAVQRLVMLSTSPRRSTPVGTLSLVPDGPAAMPRHVYTDERRTGTHHHR
jgi:diacylglycerol O-acyltransferase / wax synthase